MAKLLYQGHGSYRIISGNGKVIYVDPYVGEGYDVPADFILVSHQHGDHNQIEKAARKQNCKIITEKEALANGNYNSFSFDGIEIEAVEAKNLMHNPKNCVGYIIALDGFKIYASGDTSKTKQMESFTSRNIDYALLCCDGVFNMGLKEAAECARLIGAKHNIPVHMKPGQLFDRKRAENFNAPNRLILEPGQEIEL